MPRSRKLNQKFAEGNGLTSLFDILINIATNTASFESGMQRVEARLGAIGDLVKSSLEFGGVSLGLAGLADSFTKAAESGEQLTQLSARLGTSVQSLSQLQYAAAATSVPFQTLTGAIDTFQRNLVQASEGSGRARQALSDLGVDAGKLAALPLDAQLGIIANRIAALPNPTQQTAAAMRIFGGAGADLLPILRDGAAGIEAFRQKADEMGVTLSTDTVQALAKANDAITDFKATSHAFWTELSADAAPAVSGLLTTLTQLAGGFKNLTFGFSSPQLQLDNLVQQATAISNDIDRLNANSKGGQGFISRLLGGDVGQMATDTAALAALGAQIAKVQEQASNDLQPVKVQAQRIGGATDTSQLDQINFTQNGHMLDTYYAKLLAASQTDVQNTADDWQKKEDLARDAYNNGLIDLTQFQAKVADLSAEYLSPVVVTAKQIGKITKTVFDDMEKYAQSAATSMQNSFATFLEDPSVNSFKKMGVAWLQTLDKMAADAAASSIFKILFGDSATSSLTGSLGGILGLLFGTGSGNLSAADSAALGTGASTIADNAFGFANGGSFDVGGSGGTDSQMVSFKATPGEHVQVGQNGGGGDITIQNYVTVTSPQVSKADVLGAMQQTQTSTVNKLKDMKRRGQF